MQEPIYVFSIDDIEKVIKNVIVDKMPSPIAIKGQPDLKEEEWNKEVFYFPLEPRKPISGFDPDSGFFVSQNIPLRIVARLSEERILYQKEEEDEKDLSEAAKKRRKEYKQVKLMFKYGDDLRQDNLVLQLFKIMDRLWMQNSLNLEMTAYNVIETGDKIGYIEFVDNAVELAQIHRSVGTFKGPFTQSCILDYVENLWKNSEDFENISRRQFH